MEEKELSNEGTPEETKPKIRTSHCYLDMNSKVGQFFMLNDGELIKKYDLGPIDDEDE